MSPTGFPDYYQGFFQPNFLYVDTTDVLRIAAATSQSGETITVNYRQILKDRTLKRGQFTISPAADRAVHTQDESLAEGFLISVSCKAAAATSRGQTFARIFLTDSVIGLGQPSLMMMADYVTTRMAGSWPTGRILAPIEGPGWFHSVSVSAPVAGLDWSYSVPSNARMRIGYARASLVCSASPSNRAVAMAFSLGGTVSFVGYAETDETAGGIVNYTFSPVRNVIANRSDALWVPVPANAVMLGGDFIESTTSGLLGGDVWGSIAIGVEEWLDNV